MIGPAPSSSITVYFADSSCSKPTFISLQVASSTQCTPVTACIYDKQGSGAYTKTQCSSQPVSISSIASSTFPTAYVQFNRHIDNECQALKAIEAKAVGACIYGAEDGISPGSHMVFIHASDASVSVSTYAAQDCSGLETSKSLYPGKEICYSNVNVDYARVSVFVGTATSIEGTTNASAPLPAGAIAGGSVSCVVVLTAFIAFCVYIARQKKHVAETQHVGSDSLQECILAPDTSSSNIASTHFMAVYSVSTPSQPRAPTPTSIVMSSITASGDHSPRLTSGAHSKLNSRETAFDLNTPETTAIERLRRLVADPIRSSYFVEREAPKEYTMFGALWLPVLPHQWETHEVAEWVKQNGAAEEIVRFIKS
ncbi:hypothetical protein BC830DRAFT_69524 [Chytriomyces sp. MP71]|nr:hypothetical protein BC830DRAFT_69524 [Chytriomyces sp. MP71]